MFFTKKKEQELIKKIEDSEKPKLINNLDDLAKLIDIMKDKKVDCIKVEGLELYISRHEYKELAQPKAEQDDEEALYWST